MPNRVIREKILTSDKVNALSWTGEIFFRRLMSVVDDYGRFDGRASILRSSLYPLKLDKVSEADLVKWMGECSETGLVSFYFVNEKPYLEIVEFNQTVRIKREKYPKQNVLSICLADDTHMRLETNPNPNPDLNPKLESESRFEITVASPNYYFKIRELVYKEKPSDYFNKNFVTFKQQYESKNGNEISQEALDQMDTKYNMYQFTNENHFRNTFTSLHEKLKKDAKFKPNSYNERKAGLIELNQLSGKVLQGFELNENYTGPPE